MDYVFSSVNLSIFDVHITLQPLLLRESQAVQSSFLFLVIPDIYRNRYLTTNVTTTTLSINPLSLRTFKKNHFWKKYKEIKWLNNAPDFWKLQIPFIVTPKMNISPNNQALFLESKGIKATVKPEIFLSAIGWSTNISIHLEGEITPQELVKLINIFRNGADDIQPFLVEENAIIHEMTLGKLYESIAGRLRSEVYQAPPADIRSISRYHVLSIRKYQGTPLLYKKFPHDKPQTDKMKVAEQSLMHSLMYGRPVSREETLEQIQESKILFTQFDDANFALTEFDHGTLHFMQELGRKNLSPETVDCMGNNICNFLRMFFLLYRSYKNATSASQLNAKATALCKRDIRDNIKLLPMYYTNKFCQEFYDTYSGLNEFINN